MKLKLRELSRATSIGQADATKTRIEVEALQKKLEAEQGPDLIAAAATGRELHSGEPVRIRSLNKTGIVLGSHRSMVEVEVDGKRVLLPLIDVTPLPGGSRLNQSQRTPGWSAELQEEENASDRLNIIGLRVEEGLAEVARFIDHAGLHHFSVVTVIHGLGTGALKMAVADFLKNHPLIASIRQGEAAEGGAGVTIAEFKK